MINLLKDKKEKANQHIVKGSTSEKAPILEVINISKKFGDVTALNSVSLTIKRGERVGLIGGNGAGKTTLSEIVVGLNKPTSGTIKYGFEFTNTPQERLGMQFQDSTYPSGLSVKDIVRFALRLHNVKMNAHQIKELLTTFQMEDFYGRRTRSLSGGQRQKLNILLSFLHQPELVILDELSTGLDIEAREEIIKFADTMLAERGTTMILISHHMEEIRKLCDRIVILASGTIIDDAPLKKIEEDHGDLGEYIKEVIKKDNIEKHEALVARQRKGKKRPQESRNQ